MGKAVFYSWLECIECRDNDKVFRVRWPDGKEQMKTHLDKEHDLEITDEELSSLEQT